MFGAVAVTTAIYQDFSIEQGPQTMVAAATVGLRSATARWRPTDVARIIPNDDVSSPACRLAHRAAVQPICVGRQRRHLR
jgi:hypothetical protein